MIEISMAIVVHNGKILIAQRKKGKHQEFMWEFPGGKLEANETLQEWHDLPAAERRQGVPHANVV